MTRSFERRPVEPALLEHLIELATWAPSAGKTQGWHVVVLRDDDTMAMALNKMGDGGFRHIPIVRGGELVGMITARDVMGWVLGKYFD